jgi:uncharacterized protein (DUF2252 family)
MVSGARAGDPAAHGKSLRTEVPRSSHGAWDPPADRPDPVHLLEAETRDAVAELVPIRYERMLASPFTFFRGAAGIMAADLASTPSTGLEAQLCGDAHLSNFGGFATPERDLVFDLNDFDETLPGPWEWDVKRLATSVQLAGRERGVGSSRRGAAVRDTVASYRSAIRRFAGMAALDLWYSRTTAADVEALARKRLGRRAAERVVARMAKARGKDSARAFGRLAATTNGSAHIKADPPLVVPVADLVGATEAERLGSWMEKLLHGYRASLGYAQKQLVDRYELVDMARRVGGIGSVGTRCWVLLLMDRAHGEPLFLQAKEAQRSAIEPHVRKSRFDNQGQRIVEGQRLIQGASDIFLGWLRTTGIDGVKRDFYLRQLWDWKLSADVDSMNADSLSVYGELCGATLARAHAHSPHAQAIGAYLGSGGAFDAAIAEFAHVYADQTERDHDALSAAVSR